MKALAWVVAVWFMLAGSVFIAGKLKNDGNIARDTTRAANALEKIVSQADLPTQLKERRLR